MYINIMAELNVNFENLEIGKTYLIELIKKEDEEKETHYIAQVVKKHHGKKVTVNILMTKYPSNISDWEENETDTIKRLDFEDIKVLFGFPINDTEYDTLFPTHKRSHAVINKKQNMDEILRTKDRKIPSLYDLSILALPSSRHVEFINQLELPKAKGPKTKGPKTKGPKTKRGGKNTRKTRKSKKYLKNRP
jgi:hypothetical protein